MDDRKLSVHEVGDYEMRCPFADRETAERLWNAFAPTVQMILRKMDQEVGKTVIQSGLPEIRGVGISFDGELLTAFGEGYSVTFLDAAGLKRIAERLPPSD